ncbi:hypothetical protein [Natrialba taiwanensis]|uniref:Uncharacterized protein n=1 Tax=Natrialba taiwanensis DSM 12281 TaxID=1230458 RepID=M0A3Z3_9EURY|nr:hypothetical protein [Natrialba taiwanensis]ELY92612.1 hypothetical protein C484_08288 [Natrialba taiwanensis DSM 12281]
MTGEHPSDHGDGEEQRDEYGPGTMLPTGPNADSVSVPDSVSSSVSAPGTLPVVGGAILALSGIRSLLRGRLRSLPIGAAGLGLLGYGLRKRREEGSAQTALASFGETTEESVPGDETADEDASSGIEFVDDEEKAASPTGSKPELDSDEHDPRRNTDDDDHLEIDVSESATRDEVSEATGPDPEQAEPVQTEATEPERTPDGDSGFGDEEASDAATEPDDDRADEDDGESSSDVTDDNGTESDTDEADADT